jgi:hypothetical protein
MHIRWKKVADAFSFIVNGLKRITLQNLCNLTTICGVVIALLQFHYYTQIESAKLMIEFNNQLRNGQSNYSDFLEAVDNDNPILKTSGGKFSDIQIDNFLVEWELLEQMREKHLISEDMLYDAFSYEVEATWNHKDIQTFIRDARKQDNSPDLYSGFQDLAQHFTAEDKKEAAPSLVYRTRKVF